MKKHIARYGESSVMYWPLYKSAVGAMVYFSIIFVIFFLSVLYSCFDATTSKERLICVLVLMLIITLIWVIIVFISKIMLVKITVTHSGIEYINHVKECKQISWTQVSKVYFHQDTWRGRKTCRIYTDSLVTQIIGKGAKEYFVLPIQEVDENQLLFYIPTQLWENDPKNVF